MTPSEVEFEMQLAGIEQMKQVARMILEPQGHISPIRKDGESNDV